jgi:hypothetical protein
MYNNQSSAVRWRRNRSTFTARSIKLSVMRVAKVVRTKAVRMAWILVTFAPMIMLYNASRADESVAAQRPSHSAGSAALGHEFVVRR